MELLNKKTVFILLIVIIIIAAFFRFYKLAEIPPGLYPDVAMNGSDALDALRSRDFRVFYPENNGREGLFINLIALSFHLFGISVLSLKLVPTIIGVLTVLGIYLMVKELFSGISDFGFRISDQFLNSKLENYNLIKNSKLKIKNYSAEAISLLSSFFLAISFWHVNFSRLGFRAIMVPFILVWSFYFLFRGIKLARISFFSEENSNIIQKMLAICYWLLAGLLFGLGFHTYIAFRVAPAILSIAFCIEIFNYWQARKSSEPKNSRRNWTLIILWCILFAAVIAAALPMIIYFHQNPQDFMSRTSQVSVLASPEPIKGLAISVTKSLGMFNFSGDCNWRHNYACEPALPLPIGILFLFGFFRCLGEILRTIYKWRNHSAISKPQSDNWSFAQTSLFLMSWFFVMLLPEVLTNEGLPHSLRAIGVIPAVYIFAGIGGWWVYERIKNYDLRFKNIKISKIITSLIFVFFALSIIYAYDIYFIRWGKSPETKGAFTQNLVDIGDYLNNLPEGFEKYVVVNENGLPVPYPFGLPIAAQSISFIEKTKNQNPSTIYILPDEIKFFPNNTTKIARPIIIIPINYDKGIFSALKIKFPFGNAKNENGIWIFQVTNN